jgi:3-hydroxymyristoyl/3-hydroxydecanoyl-(acyl carrier protein) dehydratase
MPTTTNNYTVISYVALETITDNVADGTFPSTITMSIVPHSGYTLQASDFFLGNDDGNNGTITWSGGGDGQDQYNNHIPLSWINNVVFTDSVGPLALSNNVIATVTMQPGFVYSGGNEANITLDFDSVGPVNGAHVVSSTANFQVHFPVIPNITPKRL